MTRSAWAVAIALLVVHGLMALHCAIHASATYDEVVYTSTGYARWVSDAPDLNPEHPPLMKRVFGATWISAALPAVETVPGFRERNQWVFGHSLLFSDWKLAPALLLRARLVTVIISMALGALILVYSARVFGARVGLAALALYALDPLTVAHASLATLDIPTAAGVFGSLAIAHSAFTTARPVHAAWAGALAGLTLAIKVSSVVVVPVLCGLAFVCTKTQRESKRGGYSYSLLAVSFVAAVIALLLACQPDPSCWLRAWSMQRQHAEVGDSAYALGLWSRDGWWWYYPLAWLIKTPIPILLATGTGVALTLRRFKWDPSRAVWVLAIPILLFAYSTQSRIDIGVRQLMPVVPFLAVAGGIAVDHCLKWRGGRIAIAVLGAWLLLGTVHVHPSEIAYANEMAGGPSQLHRRLADSNVDWGQALPDLAAYVRKVPVKCLWLRYFGMGVPEAYGVNQYRRIQGRSLGRHTNEDGPNPTGRELFALSTYHLMDLGDDPRVSEWFRSRRPVALPGYAIAVFDITGDKEAYGALARMAERISDPTTAFRAWQRVAELDPQAIEPLAGSARALSRLGRRQDAKAQCAQMLERAPASDPSNCAWIWH